MRKFRRNAGIGAHVTIDLKDGSILINQPNSIIALEEDLTTPKLYENNKVSGTYLGELDTEKGIVLFINDSVTTIKYAAIKKYHIDN